MERHTVKKVLRYGLISVVALVIVLYSLYQAQNLLRGPIINVQTPTNGQTFHQSLTSIEGTSQNIHEITINDRPIFIDEKGNFKEKELLSPGYNVVILWAKDKFGRTTTSKLELIYIKNL